MRAVISVAGNDKTGIIAKMSGVLYENGVNIEDISQTVMQGYFVMIMIAEIKKGGKTIADLSDILNKAGKEIGVDVRVQHEDIFNSMHRI